MIEAEFQDEFVEYLRTRHCFVKPLVGHALMSGMPDIFVINKNNKAFHIEFKIWKLKSIPLELTNFTKLLEGPQRRIITAEFWGRQQFCPIIALSKYTNYCHYCAGTTDSISHYINWHSVAQHLATGVK